MARLNKTWKAESDKRALASELHAVLEISHRQAKGLIDASCVKVNGTEAHSYGMRLHPGDELVVAWDSARTYQALPSPRKAVDETGFRILQEDQHVVFVDKPAGLLTVPAEKGHEMNLAEALTDHYRRRGFKRFNLYIVHRLDRYTSGVLVFAKTPEALHGLKTIFGAHRLQRVYKAILVGELPENSGTLIGKLIERKDLKMAVVQPRKEDKGAKAAVTHYRVLERLPGHTVVEVKLETGRRNQIRVQFADRGFPLLGDQVYGEKSELLDRQALHAEILGFRHPVSEEQVTVSAPLPRDMENALRILRTQRRVERAEAGVQGEEGIFKPKITKGRKFDRVQRAQRYTEEKPEAARPERYDRNDRNDRNDRPARPGRGTRPTGDRPAGRPRTGDQERPARPARPRTSEGERSSAGRPRTASTARPSSSSRPAASSRPSARPGSRPGAGPKGSARPAAKGGKSAPPRARKPKS